MDATRLVSSTAGNLHEAVLEITKAKDTQRKDTATTMATSTPFLHALASTRRHFLGSAAVVTMVAARLSISASARAQAATMNEKELAMTTTQREATPEGPGSVSGAPSLPAGFTD